VGKDEPSDGLAACLAGIQGPVGVAVSGGSDSLALLMLCVRQLGRDAVFAVTVDHGLRAAAAQEAADVARICDKLGVAHDTLRWQGWDGQGNLMDQARRARYALMAEWAKARGVSQVALGHTADDVAETFLMRLARRAGLDGLSAMSDRRNSNGIEWLRPLLRVRRSELRDLLTNNGIVWLDDPTNDDVRYERVRMRAALRELEAAGVPTAAIADAACNLADAQAVVSQVVHDFARHNCAIEAGDVVVCAEALKVAAPEIQRRVLVHCLKWVSGDQYGPRRSTVGQILKKISAGQDATANGCRILIQGDTICVTRELAAVSTQRSEVGALWDGRWIVTGEQTSADGMYVSALGEDGLNACPHWRDSGLNRVRLVATPAVWHKAQLIAAPLAGFGSEWRAELSRGASEFYSSILSR